MASCFASPQYQNYRQPQQVFQQPQQVFQQPQQVFQQPQQVYQQRPNDDSQEYEDADGSYEYSYKVEDDYKLNYHNRYEKRTGNTVNGRYSVVDPDGSLRTVEYSASPNTGFVAKVSVEENVVPAIVELYSVPVRSGYGSNRAQRPFVRKDDSDEEVSHRLHTPAASFFPQQQRQQQDSREFRLPAVTQDSSREFQLPSVDQDSREFEIPSVPVVQLPRVQQRVTPVTINRQQPQQIQRQTPAQPSVVQHQSRLSLPSVANPNYQQEQRRVQPTIVQQDSREFQLPAVVQQPIVQQQQFQQPRVQQQYQQRVQPQQFNFQPRIVQRQPAIVQQPAVVEISAERIDVPTINRQQSPFRYATRLPTTNASQDRRRFRLEQFQ